MNAIILAVPVAVLVLSAQPLDGQQWRPGVRLDAAWNTWTVAGNLKDRELLMATVELSRPVLASGRVSLRYVMAATPLAVVASPASRKPQEPICDSICPYSGFWSGWDKRYGAGLAPLGVQLEVRVAQLVSITGAAQSGALWFSRSVPVDGSGRVTFAAGINAGAVVTIPSFGRLRGGYGLLHLSNAGLATRNPGLNANVWFLSWSP